MKSSIIFITACAFLLLNAGPAMPSELSDLKEKIESLQQTIDQLKIRVQEMEEKQESQAEQVEKVAELTESVESLEGLPSRVFDKLEREVNFGGHLKFFVLDRTDGERNDKDQNNNLSAGINDLYLYVSKALTGWLSLDVVPKISVLASATPGLGGDISRSTSSSVDTDLDEAYMSGRLPYPYDVEFKVGAFYPFFSEEYARQTWWHEQYHGNKGLLPLQSWRANGLEIYRNFDFELFSLPVYLYPYLNGDDEESRYVDNNGTKNVLLHVAPEYYGFGSRVRLLGSVGWGKWDDDDDNDAFQYAVGADFKREGLSLSGEYLSRHRDNVPLLDGGTADADNEGYYLRAMYTFNPKWRTLLKWSDVDLAFPSTTMLTDEYKTLSFAVNYWITPGSTIIPQIEYVDAERSDSSEVLEYIRYTLGWRTTF
ncbi:MAG: hypothetical protein ABUK19_06345 [Desulfobacteria bacterium]